MLHQNQLLGRAFCTLAFAQYVCKTFSVKKRGSKMGLEESLVSPGQQL